MQNKLMEQTLKFREMMLAERESRLLEREQSIAHQENNINQKKQEIQSDVASYLKQVPSALGAIIKEFATSKKDGLGKSKEKPKKERQAAEFTIEEDETPTTHEDNFSQEEIDAEIAKYEEQEQEQVFENSTTSVQSELEDDTIEFEDITPSSAEQNKSSPEIESHHEGNTDEDHT